MTTQAEQTPSANSGERSGPRLPRPAIAIISNSQPPYRLALHRRIAREIPGIQLWSLYTHENSNANWQFVPDPEIGSVLFGKGEHSYVPTTPRNILREWKRGGRIIRWMKERHIQFVVTMGYNDAGRMRMIRWCRRAKLPCFIFGDSNIRGDQSAGAKALLKRVVVGRVVRWCAGALVCGSLGRDYFLKYGAAADRIFYFPYEPDYQLIEGLAAEKIQAVRQRMGLDAQRRRLVYSGRLVAEKGVDLLIQSFIAIAAQRLNWDLMIVGDGPMLAKLTAMVPVALSDRVRWAGFVDDQETVSAIYRLSDVLVLPSIFEPWALVINEAAAAGMALISSDVVGASAEILRDGINGRLFPAGDLSGLINALLDVTDPLHIDAMKQASPNVLADWRRRGDPVTGLLAAMRSVGIVPSPGYRT